MTEDLISIVYDIWYRSGMLWTDNLWLMFDGLCFKINDCCLIVWNAWVWFCTYDLRDEKWMMNNYITLCLGLEWILDMHQMPVWTSTTLVIICLSNTTLFWWIDKKGEKDGIHYKR